MNFLSQLTSTSNPWINGMSQYQVGVGNPVTLSTSDFYPSTALPAQVKGNTLPVTGLKPAQNYTAISSTQVVNMILGESKNGGVPAPTTSTLYLVFTPPGAIDYIPSASGKGAAAYSSTTTWGGYHLWDNAPPKGVAQFAYAVVPFPGSIAKSGFGALGLSNTTVAAAYPAGTSKLNQSPPAAMTTYDALTISASYQVANALTNPYVVPAMGFPPSNFAAGGWFLSSKSGKTVQPLGLQIADRERKSAPVNVSLQPLLGAPTNYQVAPYWSNMAVLSTDSHEVPKSESTTPQKSGPSNSSQPDRPKPSASQPPNSKPVGTPTPTPTPTTPPSLKTPKPGKTNLPKHTPTSTPTPTPTPTPIPTPTPTPTIPGSASPVQPTVAASYLNPNDLAVASQNYLAVSTNDGASWGSAVTFPTASNGGSSLVYDPYGQLYWTNLDAANNGIALAVVNPTSGAIAGGPYTVDAPPAGSVDVQQDLAADDPQNTESDNLYAVWTRLGPSGSSAIMLSLSTNQGQTWLPPVTVASSSSTSLYGATVTAGPDGTIYVAYHSQPGYSVLGDGGIQPDGTSGQTLVSIYTYNATSKTLAQQGSTITAFAAGQSDVTFNDQSGTRTIPGTQFLTQGSVIPQVLVDPSQPGTVYVVTAEDPDAGTSNPPSSEVVLATLGENSDGTWSTVSTSPIAPPSSPSTVFQLFPTASIDPNGDIAVSWYSNDTSVPRNSSGDYLLDVDATYSTDGGQTWEAPFQVAAQPFDPDAGAVDVLNGPPPTTGIGNSFGLTIDDGTVFVAHDGNTYNGSTPVGLETDVDSFAMPGVLQVPPVQGQNDITIRQTSSNSGVDEVLLNGVLIYEGPIAGIAGGITIDHGSIQGISAAGTLPDDEDDTLIVDYSNGDPMPAGGLTFDGAPGGNNVIEVNADGDYTLSDDSLTITQGGVTDTIAMAGVASAELTGGPSNDTFTLDGWGGTTTINGGNGTNTLVIAAGTVNTSQLTVSNVQNLEIAPTAGTISTAAGDGAAGYTGDNGLATLAALDDPTGVAVDAQGDLFIADSANNVVREVTPAGVITTIAGTGVAGYSGDGGPATLATLDDPSAVAVNAEGDLFIADSGNNVIREVTPAGVITTVAGNGTAGYSGDGGSATLATLDDPTGVAVDAQGDLFIADSGNNVVREVTPAGVITTIAGTGTTGYSGDGGPATQATLDDPTGVAVNAQGDVFIADSANNVVREVTPAGIITTVAGTGTADYTGDGGPATDATLFDPTGVAVDAQGDLLIADSGNDAIREVTPAGIITTVAGGAAGYSGDGGPATAAALDDPAGVAVGPGGGIFIADSGNDVIRAVTGATLDVNSDFAIPEVQVQGGGVLELDNGETLTADVVNSGTLRLGGSRVAGATIAGDYTQTTSGTLDIKLGGTGLGQFDQLHVTGNASLAGTLNVVLVGGFAPTSGDSFPILTVVGTLAGDFDTKNFPTLGPGNVFQTSSADGSYTLLVTSLGVV